MKIIETERLTLRLFTQADTEPLAKMFSDIDGMKYVETGNLLRYEDAVKTIKYWNEYHSKKGYANWAVEEKSTLRLIGKCGLNDVPELGEIEVSYMLDKSSRGKGYGTESAKASLEFGIKELRLEKIIGLTYPENTASQNVLKKIGMAYKDEVKLWGVVLMRFVFYADKLMLK